MKKTQGVGWLDYFLHHFSFDQKCIVEDYISELEDTEDVSNARITLHEYFDFLYACCMELKKSKNYVRIMENMDEAIGYFLKYREKIEKLNDKEFSVMFEKLNKIIKKDRKHD